MLGVAFFEHIVLIFLKIIITVIMFKKNKSSYILEIHIGIFTDHMI